MRIEGILNSMKYNLFGEVTFTIDLQLKLNTEQAKALYKALKSNEETYLELSKASNEQGEQR